MKDLSILNQVEDAVWEIPQDYKKGMNVPARIVATQRLLEDMDDEVVNQVTNVAMLPGLVGYSYAMPDAHWGYGAPIGAVFATDQENGGVISPGAIGFDINCGMRLIRTSLTEDDVKPHIKEIVDGLFDAVPTGVGSSDAIRGLSDQEMENLMKSGMQWCIDKGFGWENDREHAEEYGLIEGADPEKVSEKAVNRGRSQLGTLGSGNHYLEVQVLKRKNIFDWDLAEALGLFPGQVVIMVHCGSRGFGHQIATEYLNTFEDTMEKYDISVPDKQLACAPVTSKEGQDYYGAMAAAANFAFANRQLIMHLTRQVFSEILNADAKNDLEMDLVYDVAHNIAKKEEYETRNEKFEMGKIEEVEGNEVKEVLVHRKGATRAFGVGNEELPEAYKNTGQPVIIGGSMETGSYLLVGTQRAEELTFGSTAHGSGRTMSRSQAKKEVWGEDLQEDMEERGIYVKAASMAGLAEEAGKAYKDIHEVVRAVESAGISRAVAGFSPIGNIKG